MTYKGSAPIFCTTKLSDMVELEKAAAPDPDTGLPTNADASMIMRRLKIYPFKHKIAKPAKLTYCAHCFAEFICTQARVHAGGPL